MGLFGNTSKAGAQVEGQGNIVVQNVKGNVTINQARREQVVEVVNEYLREQGVSREDLNSNRKLAVPLPRDILHQINCNRKHFKKVFEAAFRTNPPPGHRLFVLPSTPNQQPGSFAERMVLELQTERSKIIHRPVDDEDRMQFIDLQLGLDLEDSKMSIAEQVNEYLGYAHGEINALSDYYTLDSHLNSNDYIVLPFTLQSSMWEPFAADVLEWLLHEFCDEKGGCAPGFLFFITIVMEGEPKKKGLAKLFGRGKSKHQEIMDALKPLEKHQRMVLFDPLPGVPLRDLKAWFREGNWMKNELRICQLINTMLAQSEAELATAMEGKSFAAADDHVLDMSYVELLLEDIIRNNQSTI